MGCENHHHYHQNLHIHHRSTFLPMLCSRPSIKDVSLPKCRDHKGSFSNDPLSPRIGCLGQVMKRENKVAGSPTSQQRLSFNKTKSNNIMSVSSPIVKYSKLKKLFSSKNLSTPTIATTTSSSCGSRPPQFTVNNEDVPRNRNKKGSRDENSVPISIENMDPPLPVIKRVRKLEEESQVDSLWKRRSGGAALQSLQVQQIHHTKNHPQLTSVL